MATLTVGAGQQYSTIAGAVAASRDGDILQVQDGTYTNDFAQINTKITLQGVGGMVKMVATGAIPNGKGILIANTDVTIDHFEFSGAQVSDQNGAGIRYQGGNLVVTNSYFHDNQNGILANPVANGTITIDNSEFDHNGAGDGYTHNLYVGEIAKLTITDSYFPAAVVGHQIKSRAAETIVANTRIYDNSGSSSYSIDLPNGGNAVLTDNIIQQGANGQNPNVVTFGVEGNLHPGSSLTMTNNIIVNDMSRGTLLFSVGGAPATVTGTQVWLAGEGQVYSGTNVTFGGTINLASRPNLDTSQPFGAAPTTPGGPLNLLGGAGDDNLQGGAGADTINGGDGQNYLRGNDGNDVIQGGSGFDDANGNKGNDTVYGGTGNDWVVGGQDQDLLFGQDGNDIVYGNIGNDTCYGDAGADTIRGGQNDDVLFGGAGADWLSGDRGSDTMTGGSGADTFHTWGEAGVDRVLDFNYSEGDRVQIELGTTFSAVQSGSDVLISMNGVAEMTLAGVSLASLGAGWIFAA